MYVAEAETRDSCINEHVTGIILVFFIAFLITEEFDFNFFKTVRLLIVDFDHHAEELSSRPKEKAFDWFNIRVESYKKPERFRFVLLELIADERMTLKAALS